MASKAVMYIAEVGKRMARSRPSLSIARTWEAGSKSRAISSAYRSPSVFSSTSERAGQSPWGMAAMTWPSTIVRMSQRRSLSRRGARALNSASM